MSRWAIAVFLLAGWSLQSHGKAPPPVPATGPAPLLYVRFGGPLQARFYQGDSAGRVFVAPVSVGLRPGYIYRVMLTNIPEHPGLSLYPTLEVRGTLQLPPNLRAANYPAPVTFSDHDIERALAGGLVTKVIYLEDPKRAFAVATLPGQPLETEILAGRDPLAEARSLGRPLLIVRLGQRTFSADELARESIPGTILFPGEQSLPAPAVRPCVPWASLPVYDPYYGPRHGEEECLEDGGDAGLPAGFDNEGRLHGLDPADTVAEYKDSRGRLHLAVSNRVCICVPRFAVLLTSIVPIGYESAVALDSKLTLTRQALMERQAPSLEAKQSDHLEAMRSRERASETENSSGLVEVDQVEGLVSVLGRIHEQVVVGALVEQTAPPPDRPLLLCKWADKQSAQVGDVVTFYLKYTNSGGQPISDVVVSDSLTGRLEYVPGSAKADRANVFSMKPNEAGSQILRWEISGLLQPGQSGLVSFQARIR